MDRIEYVDLLKFLAITAIIFLHICGIWESTGILNVSFDNMKELFRFGVPLFLAVTGMLTLNKEIELDIFFKKKFVRIVYPLIFFFIIAYLLDIYELIHFFDKFWYCWMVIGVYLAIPIVNIFIKNASEKDIEYALIIFIIATVIYYLASIFKITVSLDLTFFITPISYLVLGYWLSRKEFKSSPQTIVLISFITFVLISLFKIFVIKDFLYFNNHDPLYSRLSYTLPEIIQVASVFLFCRYLYEVRTGIANYLRRIVEYNYIQKFIESVSRASYGIYLLHMIFILKFIKKLGEYHMSGTETFFAVIVVSTLLLITTWICILILSRIPVIKKFSGYS